MAGPPRPWSGPAVRVFVGRAEVITPEFEKAVLAVVNGHEEPIRPEDAKKTLLKLGRFGEPALKRLAAASTDPAVTSRIHALLAAAN